jgi:glycosyltransferase involved in cell wall biosynthesis
MTRVVMLVTNNVYTDTRVKKEALAVSRMGLDVTVLGLSDNGHQSVSMIGPVRIVRVPIDYVLRERRRHRREQRRKYRPPFPGYRGDSIKAARLRLQLRRNDLAAKMGRAQLSGWSWITPVARANSSLALRGRNLSFRIRVAAGRRVDRGLSKAWRLFDGGFSRLPLGARWRRELPEVHDFELAFAPAIDELHPHVIHAHDMQVIGVAAQSVARARSAGRDVRMLYDAHEFVPGLSRYGGRTPRVIAAWADLEREFIWDADGVITVSPPIAAELKRIYSLRTDPVVVLNTPVVDPSNGTPPSLRDAAGVPVGIPLITYSGGMTPARGVHTAVDAMLHLADMHLALVCVPHNDTYFVRILRRQVDELGLRDRVHFLNPVPPGQVVPYLRSADIGLIPFLHFPSHDMTLTNKMFEYMNAGIPLVVSDCRAQREFVEQHGLGQVFPAGDVEGLVRAIRDVLADRDRYAANASDPALLDAYSWRRQEEVLRGLYERVLGRELPWTEVVATGDGRRRQVIDLSERQVGTDDRS